MGGVNLFGEKVIFPSPNSGNTVVFDIECMHGEASEPQRRKSVEVE